MEGLFVMTENKVNQPVAEPAFPIEKKHCLPCGRCRRSLAHFIPRSHRNYSAETKAWLAAISHFHICLHFNEAVQADAPHEMGA